MYKQTTATFLIFLSGSVLADLSSTSDRVQKETSNLEFKLGALLQADVISQLNEEQSSAMIGEQHDFRRARLISKFKLYGTRIRVDYDFGISEGLRNVYASWRFGNNQLTIGQHTPPFSMENLNSSKSHVFLDRSSVNSLTPGLSLGVSYRSWADNWSRSYGIFDQSIREVQENDNSGTRLVTRFTYAPLNKQDLTTHFGFNYQVKLFEEQESIRIRTRPASRLVDQRLVDTGKINGIDNKQTAGAEFSVNTGHFRLQGEYIGTLLTGVDQDIVLHGGYVETGIIFGAGRYRYSHRSALVRPALPKTGHTIEFSIRAAELDLTDSAVNGGLQQELNYALSWSANRHYKLSLNYSEVDTTPDQFGENTPVDLIGLRLQYSR